MVEQFLAKINKRSAMTVKRLIIVYGEKVDVYIRNNNNSSGYIGLLKQQRKISSDVLLMYNILNEIHISRRGSFRSSRQMSRRAVMNTNKAVRLVVGWSLWCQTNKSIVIRNYLVI